MHFSKLVPNIFYVDIKDGLVTFVDCLQFSIVHDELKTARPFCVLAKGDITINFFRMPLWPVNTTRSSDW